MISKEERCKHSRIREWYPVQCANRAVRDGFCNVHHPDAVALRKKKSDERYERKKRQWDQAAIEAKQYRKYAEIGKRVVHLIHTVKEECMDDREPLRTIWAASIIEIIDAVEKEVN